MNEHQTPTRSSSGVRENRTASPGGNSPVIGGTAPDLDRPETGERFGTSRASGGQDLRSHPTRADLPHRVETRRDETIRAGEHRDFRNTGAATDWQVNSLPVLAVGLGGGLLFGWLIARMTGSNDQSEWEDTRYSPERHWRRQDSFGARSSGYASRRSRSVPTDETWNLIASDKVEGTPVYNRNGERLGTVYNFMVGKRSGQVAYAVMSFGGWLGVGESYHPLPWNALTYDTDLGGYVVNLDKDRLRNAPSHRAGHDTSSDPGYWQRVKDYWA
jgi:hypothetical protein